MLAWVDEQNHTYKINVIKKAWICDICFDMYNDSEVYM